jgi:hypothetical protein
MWTFINSWLIGKCYCVRTPWGRLVMMGRKIIGILPRGLEFCDLINSSTQISELLPMSANAIWLEMFRKASKAAPWVSDERPDGQRSPRWNGLVS